MKKRNGQRVEPPQIKFFKHLLGVIKLDREGIQPVSDKLGVQNAVREAELYQRGSLLQRGKKKMETSRGCSMNIEEK
jgi:hypothetical protein